MLKPFAIALLLFPLLTMQGQKKYTMLCLGDSYTIGESVAEKERFPMQTMDLLKHKGIEMAKPEIIATTGWTTDELAAAIKEKNLPQHFDLVTLLIGVNNEFRGRSEEEYRQQFIDLLNTAIKYANGNRKHVFVIAIPDWGATPFAAKDPRHRTPAQIGAAIDRFNQINKEEALKAKVHYTDINPISKKAVTQPDLVAHDGLHPSGKMYAEWAKLLAVEIEASLQ